MEIGNIILEERKRLGLNQAQTQERTGINQALQSKYESNKRQPSRITLIRYSQAFDNSPRMLMAACRRCEVSRELMRIFNMPNDDSLQIAQLCDTADSLLGQLKQLQDSPPPKEAPEYGLYRIQVIEIMKRIALEANAHAATFGKDDMDM